ncbi:MAG: CapA family protein [Spirochaetota bacterium]
MCITLPLSIIIPTFSCERRNFISIRHEEPRLPPLNLSLVGDIMAHDVNYSRPPYSKIYERVKNYFMQDDLTFGNLEFPIDPDKPMSNYPLFNIHPAYVKAAVEAGFDVFSLANNHICDQGPDSILKTLDEIEKIKKEKEIFYSGIKNDENAPYRITTIMKKGWKIGFLALTEFLNIRDSEEYVYLLDYHNKETRDELINLIKKSTEDYDLLILSYHGGVEYASAASTEKISFFYDLIDAGVHIVWGHHPHVLQPWEIKEVKGLKRLIIPSAGNFISGQTWNIDPVKSDIEKNLTATGESAIYSVKVAKSGLRTAIISVKAVPIANYQHPEYGMIVYPFEELLKEKLPDRWSEFYKNRFKEVQKMLADNYIRNFVR